jgi:hypothetical protein
MADDAIMSTSFLVVLAQDEMLEKTPINVNVSQRPRKEKSIKKVVHTQVV